jgi:hypothetical protein
MTGGKLEDPPPQPLTMKATKQAAKLNKYLIKDIETISTLKI